MLNKYFTNTLLQALPPFVKYKDEEYLSIMTRTSVAGVIIGHPGIISKSNYDKWSSNGNNAIKVYFLFSHLSDDNYNRYNIMTSVMIKDIVVTGKSHIKHVRAIRSYKLSTHDLLEKQANLTDKPVVFKIIGLHRSIAVINNVYRFIGNFKYVQKCQNFISDEIRENSELFVELFPLELCTSIFDRSKISGAGIVIKIVSDGVVLGCQALLLSNHRSNIYIVDGSKVCKKDPLCNEDKGMFLKLARTCCIRNMNNRLVTKRINQVKRSDDRILSVTKCTNAENDTDIISWGVKNVVSSAPIDKYYSTNLDGLDGTYYSNDPMGLTAKNTIIVDKARGRNIPSPKRRLKTGTMKSSMTNKSPYELAAYLAFKNAPENKTKSSPHKSQPVERSDNYGKWSGNITFDTDHTAESPVYYIDDVKEHTISLKEHTIPLTEEPKEIEKPKKQNPIEKSEEQISVRGASRNIDYV